MTTTQAPALACTPDAVHGWLVAHDPDGLRRFDVEFRDALTAAGENYDLGPVDHLVRRWWASIWGKSQQLSLEEVAQYRRLDLEGDSSGLHRHDTRQ